MVFGVTFNIGKSDKVAPTINITLATHAADKEPDKADFLAQHNQQASGSEKKVKELTTTELAKVTDVAVNKVNPLPAQAPQSIEDIQKEIIKTRGESLRKAAIQEQTNDPLRKNKALKELERADARSEKLASLQAKLDQQRQAMAKEPRVTRHTSVSAKSSDEAAYYNKWSNKIVRIGNKNFPKEALKNEIFRATSLISQNSRRRQRRQHRNSGVFGLRHPR